MPVLEELEQVTQEVGERVGPSVVGVNPGWGLGSGVVVGEGLVLTNAHNVGGAETLVTFVDGRVTSASVAGVDMDGDLAVLAVDTAGTEPVGWSDTAPTAGRAVFALANPGGRGLRVSLGMVAAVGQAFRGPRGRRIRGTIEHTAPLARGSSGGPVVDADGRLLGLNTNRLGDGLYAAIPADAELKARVDDLGRGESPARVRLGVGLAPPRAARQLRRAVGLPDRDGLLVRAVEDDSPAARVGLRTGDLLVEADGRPLTGMDDLHQSLEGVQPGGSLPLRVVRAADELEVTVHFDAAAPRSEGSA